MRHQLLGPYVFRKKGAPERKKINLTHRSKFFLNYDASNTMISYLDLIVDFEELLASGSRISYVDFHSDALIPKLFSVISKCGTFSEFNMKI